MASKLGALPDGIEKQVWEVLATSDPEAPVVTRRKGDPEPDPNIHDNENAPLPPVPVTWAADPTERLASLEYRSAVEDYMAGDAPPYDPPPLSARSTPRSRPLKPRSKICCAR